MKNSKETITNKVEFVLVFKKGRLLMETVWTKSGANTALSHEEQDLVDGD